MSLTHEPRPAPVVRQGVVVLVFAAGYFLLGMAGLQLQSAQTGVTPLWPASGFAFAMAYWFGTLHVVAVLPAMLALGWVVGVPAEVATVSAVGSMLEAGAPAWLMRRHAVDPRLGHLRDVLLFVVIGPVLGPAFSATAGSIAFQMLGASALDPLRLWLLWWLGNSVGLLLVGGFGLVVVARRSLRLERMASIEWVAAALAVVVITVAGMVRVTDISSSLILYLLIPVFIFVAQRGDQMPVLGLGLVAVTVMLVFGSWLPPDSLAQADLGILYLDISLLWVVALTGMMTSSARQEMRDRERFSWLAVHDSLTRLLNRHAFMERLETLLADPRDGGRGHVLLYLDLDRFKDLNDAEGHRAGDRVLGDVAAMLVQEVRAADTVARLGGDEFAVILHDCPLLDACAVAENVRGAVERYEYTGAHGRHRIEASIGLVEVVHRHRTPEDVLHDADSACYDAKRAGRNRVWVFSDSAAEDGA